MTPREGFGVKKTPGGGTMSPSIEERKKELRKKIGIWGPVSAIALAVFGYALFGQLVPAVKEYRLLLNQEQVAAKEKLVGQTVQRRARPVDPTRNQVHRAQEGTRLVGYLGIQAFRPDPA